MYAALFGFYLQCELGGKMLNLYIIRHGQTDSNLKNTYLGKTDIPLNDTGIQQAKAAAVRFSDVEFDVIYSSPLIRAVQTAQEIADKRGLNIRLNYGIAERDYGVFDNLTMQEIEEKYPEEHSEWMRNWFDYVVPEGESAAGVHKRTGEAMDRITENYKDKNIALVTHLGAARHMIANLLQLRLEDTYRFALDNCKAAVITIDDDNRRTLIGLNI